MANLSNHFLIAMPSVDNVMFGASVIYVTEHSAASGAIGVIVNKPLGKVATDTFEDIKLTNYNPAWINSTLYLGGVIKADDAFILHRSASKAQKFELTNDQVIVSEIAKYKSKEDVLISVGYSAWSTFQLEAEIKANAWLVLNGNNDRLIFDIDPVNRYDEAMRMLGVNNIGKLYFNTLIVT